MICLGASIKTKLGYVPAVEYRCGSCGHLLGRDELREGLNISSRKLYLYDWHGRCCPGCGARLERPEEDECVVGSFMAQLYGTRGGDDAGSC